MCNVVFYFVKTLFFLLRQRSVFRKGVARDGIVSVWQSVRGDSLIEHVEPPSIGTFVLQKL